MDERQKAINTIGMIVKSNNFIYGERLLENLDKVFLIIVASDISLNSLKRIKNKANNNNTEVSVLNINSKELEFISKVKNIKAMGITNNELKKLLDKNISFLINLE
ncbi:hypothetical protein [Spiroplasma endosymbiont of Aspidapion aeneum]|uniref:hypothetical protein n=1 Tax=Spiroplasma endosymbiont of Aspidapion aeneum TaxID=3066276 RepID=UPI00313B8840